MLSYITFWLPSALNIAFHNRTMWTSLSLVSVILACVLVIYRLIRMLRPRLTTISQQHSRLDSVVRISERLLGRLTMLICSMVFCIDLLDGSVSNLRSGISMQPFAVLEEIDVICYLTPIMLSCVSYGACLVAEQLGESWRER